MAIILNFEENHYQKILLEESYININGLYLTSVVFKDKANRDKDKARVNNIDIFIASVNTEYARISALELTDEEKNEVFNNFNKAGYIARKLNNIATKIESNENNISLTEDILVEAEKYGFNRDWYTDPVIIIRKDSRWLTEYTKQDFTLDSFYNTYKDFYLNEKLDTSDDI